MTNYDYIIIGSGFGGSVSALRLSEKGYRVLVVEKGKWFKPQDFPKSNWNLKKWLWFPALRFHGIMKISFFRHISLLSGTGVGGGSLVYANTLPIPKREFFTTGSWAKLAPWESELQTHYQTALTMLGAAPTPTLYDGDLALKALAKQMGIPEQFEHTHVGVYFGKPNEATEDPYFGGKGPEREGCRFCGACMTGCPHRAKNSLDLNYLHLAQQHGAQIMAEREVVDVKPLDGHNGSTGYEVTMHNSTSYIKKKQTVTAGGVIFSGGVMGTVKLLLKLKRQSLPRLSDKLGHDIRTNNETLLSVSSLDRNKDFSKGVAIGSILHSDANSHLEVVRYARGSGFWRLLHAPYTTGSHALIRILRMMINFLKAPLAYLKIFLARDWSRNTAVLLFMQTIDTTLRFKRNALGLMVSGVSHGAKPSADIPASRILTEGYSDIVNGKPSTFVLEAIAGIPSTAHILGGAVMGEDADRGVIDKHNKVFGYERMMVIDGAMISANPGVNPSLSITAIAERAMSQIPPKSSNLAL